MTAQTYRIQVCASGHSYEGSRRCPVCQSLPVAQNQPAERPTESLRDSGLPIHQPRLFGHGKPGRPPTGRTTKLLRTRLSLEDFVEFIRRSANYESPAEFLRVIVQRELKRRPNPSERKRMGRR